MLTLRGHFSLPWDGHVCLFNSRDRSSFGQGIDGRQFQRVSSQAACRTKLATASLWREIVRPIVIRRRKCFANRLLFYLFKNGNCQAFTSVTAHRRRYKYVRPFGPVKVRQRVEGRASWYLRSQVSKQDRRPRLLRRGSQTAPKGRDLFFRPVQRGMSTSVLCVPGRCNGERTVPLLSVP